MKLSILSNLFTECWWWLLFWMFLSFLLGWLLRKLFGGGNDDDCCEELASYKRKYADLEQKYRTGIKSEKENIRTVVGGGATSANAFTSHAKQDPYARLKNTNLQIIEGIGPKMEEVLNKYNVKTWSDLAAKTPTSLRSILDEENPTRYRIIDPTTWSDQAQLAVDGKWNELIQMQKDLDTGKTNSMGGTDSKLEKMMVKLGLIKKWKKDDLKAIEGIGPKIAKLFVDNGINTWKKLADATVDELKAILIKGGDKFKLADPGTWPKQAKLADEDKWDELREYQDFLNGGK